MARFLILACVFVGLALSAAAADAPTATLYSATGTVVKANASTVIFRPRNGDGTFAKAVSLKLRGTSKVAVVSVQVRNDKPVLVQREADAKDLEPNQAIAVIYTLVDKEAVMLSAVVQPTTEK